MTKTERKGLSIRVDFEELGELRAAKGKQTKAQVAFQSEVEQNGGTYCLFRSAEEALRWGEAVKRTARMLAKGF